VHEVGAARAFRHRQDHVPRKPAGELGLDETISSTSPWRSCASCSLLRRASSSAVRKSSNQLVLLLEPEVLRFGQTLLLAVDATRDFEVELAGAGFERLSFLAQFELGLLRLPAFAPLLGELAFEEFFFDGEIRARLLLRLAGENLQPRLVLVAKLLLERVAEWDFGAAAGAGDHGRVHGRLFTAGRINAPYSQVCRDRSSEIGRGAEAFRGASQMLLCSV
jgi:hypothetical protein